MKRNQLAVITRIIAGTRSGVLAGVLGLTLVSGGLAADPEGNTSWNGPGGGVGTLPATAGNGHQGVPIGPFEPWSGPSLVPSTQTGGPDRPALALRGPALALRGTDAELDQLIALAFSPDGTGWFHIEPLATDGTRTITYYGNAVVLLERSALRTAQFGPALAIDPSQGGVLAVVTSGDRRATQVLTPGLAPLPLTRALGVGLLSNGIELEAKDRSGSTIASFGFVAEGPQIRIEQRQ